MGAPSVSQGTCRPAVEARLLGRCECGGVRPDFYGPRLINIAELAQQLATSQRHVRRLVEERRVPYLKIGHYVRFDPDDIDIWLDQHRVAMPCGEAEDGSPPWVHLLGGPHGQRRTPRKAARQESSEVEDGCQPWVRSGAAGER